MEVLSSFNLKMMNLADLDSLSCWNASEHDGSTATPERDYIKDVNILLYQGEGQYHSLFVDARIRYIGRMGKG